MTSRLALLVVLALAAGAPRPSAAQAAQAPTAEQAAGVRDALMRTAGLARAQARAPLAEPAPPVADGVGFACSFRSLPTFARTDFAAINNAQWDEGRNCGRCVSVRCVDPRCKVQGRDITLMVVDQCPECKHGDLDLSIPAYDNITGLWPNRLAFSWTWADCPPVDGSISLTTKDGSNAFWQAFYLSNAQFPIAAAALDGTPLQRQQFGFWQHPAPIAGGAHTLELTSADGRTVKGTFSGDLLSAKAAIDTGLQFPVGPGAGPSGGAGAAGSTGPSRPAGNGIVPSGPAGGSGPSGPAGSSVSAGPSGPAGGASGTGLSGPAGGTSGTGLSGPTSGTGTSGGTATSGPAGGGTGTGHGGTGPAGTAGLSSGGAGAAIASAG
eukprot:scaffold15.g4320.t1